MITIRPRRVVATLAALTTITASLLTASPAFAADPTPPSSSASPDVRGPDVLEFDFTPKTVDVSTGWHSISITAFVVDATGVESVAAVLLSPSGEECGASGSMDQMDGASTEGTWWRTIALSPGCPAGAYTVRLLNIRDTLGNYSSFEYLDHSEPLVVTKTPTFTPFSGTRPVATNKIGDATGDSIADLWAMTGSQLDFFKRTSTGLSRVGERGSALDNISYMGAITDQNGDRRADLFYRDSRDQSLWFAYNQGNGYLVAGKKIGQNWGGMDQIFYSGTMVAGSSQQYVLARRKSDGTLWRYQLSSKGLANGTQVGRNWLFTIQGVDRV